MNFRVGVEGDDPISLQWLFNGQPLLGEHGWALVVENVATSHSGTYQCRATNPFGTALSAAAHLVVQAATSPIIVLQPQDATPAVGDYVSLVVVALGTPPPGLQWFKDGLPLENETNRTMILPQFNSSQAGRYNVVVSNLAESVTSFSARPEQLPGGTKDGRRQLAPPAYPGKQHGSGDIHRPTPSRRHRGLLPGSVASVTHPPPEYGPWG